MVVGLGTVWILDGLEVTIVGSMSGALKPESTGLGLINFDIGVAGAVYVAGACTGALGFGHLTDRFGRKKLFLITLGVFTVATVLTAFSMTPLWYFAARFLTGAGIGGEYAAIDSAIDELIPAKYRGRGALLIIPLLDPTFLDPAWGWRLAFGLGAVLAIGILLVRPTFRRAHAGSSSAAMKTRLSGSQPASRSGQWEDGVQLDDVEDTVTFDNDAPSAWVRSPRPQSRCTRS